MLHSFEDIGTYVKKIKNTLKWAKYFYDEEHEIILVTKQVTESSDTLF